MQFGFTQHKHRSRHRRRGERHWNHEWKGVIETLMPGLQSMLLRDFDILIPLYCSTSKLTCLWAIFHRLSLFRQTPVSFGGSSKNMYMDEPESWNHFVTDSLNRSLLEQSAAIIASSKKENEKNDAVTVQSVSSFRRQLHCHYWRVNGFSRF